MTRLLRRIALLGVLALAGLAQIAAPANAAPPVNGDMRKFILHDAPKPVAKAVFQDENGKEIDLSAFRGKLVLLNLWATWCVPCRVEMPDLNRLQGELGSERFQVVAIAQDRSGREKVQKFLAEIGATRIVPYLDSTMKSARSWGALGLPTTLLLDGEGREIGRLIGEAKWDGPDARALIKYFLDAAPKRAALQ